MSEQPPKPNAATFSLKGLLVACSYVALILSGWLNPQPIWAELTFLVTFVTIVLAVVIALFGSPDRRAARASFALAASAYLALTLYPGNFENFPTTRLFHSLDERIAPIRNRNLDLTSRPMGGMGGGMMGGQTPRAPPGSFPTGGGMMGGEMGGADANQFFASQILARGGSTNMPRIGHCAFAMLLGLLAAIVGQLAYQRSRATRGAD